MSDQNVDTPPSACEQLLDYVYGELDEAGRRAFEAHLESCARCAAELQSFGRVRTASQRLMPKVEPTAALSGALHAQLMHAAAQRKPKGTLLAFPRKILAHPAWAAAAMFVIVGGAITVSLVRGQFMVATSEVHAPAPAVSEAAPASAPVEAPPVPAPAVGGANKPTAGAEAYLPASKNKESEPASAGAAGGGEGLKSRRHSSSSSLGGLASSSGAAKKSAKGGGDARARESDLDLALAPGGRLAVRPTEQGKVRGAAVAKDKAEERERTVAAAEEKTLSGVDVEGSAGEGGPAPPASAPAAAMPPPPMRSVAKPTAHAPAATAAPPPVAAQAPAPAMADSLGASFDDEKQQPRPRATASRPKAAPASPVLDGYRAQNNAPSPMAAAYPAQQQRDLDQIARADELARNNRCDEAAKLFADLDRRGQRVPPKARANYLRCLSLLGRQDQAQQQLDVLKNDKSAPGTLVQQAQEELSSAVRRKAKRSAPAEYSPAPASVAAPAPTSTPKPSTQQVR